MTPESSSLDTPAPVITPVRGNAYLLKSFPVYDVTGNPYLPELLPLRVHPALRDLVPSATSAAWPSALPGYGGEDEYADDDAWTLSDVAFIAEWLTYRCGTVLAHLANYTEPHPEIAALLAVPPAAVSADERPDLLPLTACLPQVPPAVALVLAKRVRNVLNPSYRAENAYGVAVTLSEHAVLDTDAVGGDEPTAVKLSRERGRVAAALATLWMDPAALALHVPLATAYAAVATLEDWMAASRHNRVVTGPEEMRSLPVYDGPPLSGALAESVPRWVAGLLASTGDVQA